MQKLSIALVGAVSLWALPALAQTSSSPTSSSPTSTAPTPNAAPQSSSAAPSTPLSAQQVREKIMQDLTRDGYTNVRVIADSFLVHATNKQGEPVVMIINPDSVFEIAQLPGQASNGSPNSSSSAHPGLGNAPSTNGSTPTKQ